MGVHSHVPTREPGRLSHPPHASTPTNSAVHSPLMRYTTLAGVLVSPFLAALTMGQPAAKPAPHPAAKPASQPSGQPAGKPAAQPASAEKPSMANSAITPVPRDKEEWWVKRNDAMNARAKQGAEKGDIGVLFIGDSITEGWEGAGKEAWAKHFAPMNAVNLGIGGDRTQHVLWRLDHGNIDGLASPKAGAAPSVAVLMIGTNNSNGKDNTAAEIGEGITAIVKDLRAKLPTTKILILAIFPRGEKPDAQREKNAQASEIASKAADGKMVHYMDIGKTFLSADGTLSKEIMPDLLHLSPKGYEMWAEAIEGKVKELQAK